MVMVVLWIYQHTAIWSWTIQE